MEKLWKTCGEPEFLEFGCDLYHTVSTMEAGIESKSRCLWVSLVCLVLLTPMKSAVAQDYSTLDVQGKLVLANKILAMEGLVGPYGHVSVRMEGEGKFRISDHHVLLNRFNWLQEVCWPKFISESVSTCNNGSF